MCSRRIAALDELISTANSLERACVTYVAVRNGLRTVYSDVVKAPIPRGLEEIVERLGGHNGGGS